MKNNNIINNFELITEFGFQFTFWVELVFYSIFVGYKTSTAIAIPIPPPIHSEAIPFFPPVRFKA